MLHAEVTSASEWMLACSSAFVPLRVRAVRPSFRASLRQVELAPNVTLTAVSSQASDVVRDGSVIASSPRDDVLLSLQRRGSGTISQHGRTARLTPGSCALYDASTPYTLSFPGQMSEIVLQLPRDTIAHSGQTFEGLTARVLQPSGPLRALAALAGSVELAQANRHGPSDAAIAESLATLLQASLALSSTCEEPPVEAELLAAALQLHVDEHSADPRLTPEALAASFHISLRYAQKLFGRYFGTGIAAYIRQQRLARAEVLLRTRRTVTDTAYRSGFLDVDTFSRAFKREYGIAPSRVSGARITAPESR